MSEHHDVLGVRPGATPAEIRRAATALRVQIGEAESDDPFLLAAVNEAEHELMGTITAPPTVTPASGGPGALVIRVVVPLVILWFARPLIVLLAAFVSGGVRLVGLPDAAAEAVFWLIMLAPFIAVVFFFVASGRR